MRKKVLGAGVGLLAIAAVVVLALHLTRARIQVGDLQASPGREPIPLDRIDHAAFDQLLQKYVDGQGLVAYRKWKASAADVEALDRYLAYLGSANLRQPAGRPAQLAFWINAYNALTIKGILREYPTSSIRNHTPILGGYNIWRDLLLAIDGQNYSLDDMEHQILRPMGEPRIHFAVVCASRGCPPLRNRAYTAAELESQLADNARRFLAQPGNFRTDAASHTVWISELFDWYGGDFADTPARQVQALRPYLPMPDRLSWLESGDVKIKYLDYDWSLNDQEPGNREGN